MDIFWTTYSSNAYNPQEKKKNRGTPFYIIGAEVVNQQCKVNYLESHSRLKGMLNVWKFNIAVHLPPHFF